MNFTRGPENTVHEISLADLPNINPHDWIVLTNFLLCDEQKYKPILAHIKRMLVSYIHEVAKLDQEIANALRRMPTVKPIGKASDVNKMHMGQIDTEQWTMMFTKRADHPLKCMFALPDKHLFSTICLEHILDIINRCKSNDVASKKNFNDILRWYINFRRVVEIEAL